jgi:UDP-2-acetamido-3-amino-2,3-dideoxy-glucuronate N-acetyltransferase
VEAHPLNEPTYFAAIAEQAPPTWGEGCIIGAYCVLGVQPIPTAANRRAVRSDWPAGHVGSRTVIGSHCVIGAGVVIGEDCRIGDHVNIREGVKIGDRCVIGTKCDLQFECRLGEDVRIFNEAQIAGEMVIGSGTFIGPGVVTANDKRIDPEDYRDHGRHPPVIGRNVVVGMAAVILPGVHIADGAVVAAGAVVTKDVEARARVYGMPATARTAATLGRLAIAGETS